MKITVTYRNEGRPERATFNTEEEAREGAEFLKSQGATHVRVWKAKHPPTSKNRT